MNKNEWYQVGEDIKKQVQEAIDSNNFSELSKTISETVGQAVGDVGKSLNGAINGVVNEARESFQQTVKKTPHHNQQFYNTQNNSQGYNAQYNNTQGYNGQGYNVQNGNINPAQNQGRQKWARYNGSINYGKPNLRPDARLFNRHPVGSVSGIVYMAVGFSMMGIAGVVTLVFMYLAMFGLMGLEALAVPASIMAAGFGMGVHGTKLRSRVNRFKRYVDIVKEKLYCSIEELAQKTGRGQRFVRKDLKKMMKKGMFFQAHLDKKEQCFIASDSVYEQYRLTQQNFEQKQAEQVSKPVEQKAETEEAKQNRSEAQKVLDEGREYVRMIRICNDEIPGEEMSEKLDKLELLVTRIFAQVEKEPELAPELHKMLSYYLPTTQKLLEAYRDLDKQNLDVKNISDTKREIESTVDTINAAFEKFLDELFREKAWDIQSDISVLNTMLKQDGYLKNDFEREQKA